MTKPLVSICVTTYNHAAYLRGALDSFLRQRCDFPYEILVHDDVSTDGTIEILREYAQRYPGIVKPLFEEENQYSKGVPINETFNFPRAEGKYIALCEGDDYWVDERKLALQIAHMESDPKCTFSFTNGLIHDESGVCEDRVFVPYYESERPYFKGKSSVYTLDEIARLTFIPTASFVFRTDTLRNLPDTFLRPCQHGDLRMKLFLTAAGHAWYEDVCGCVYRENVSGSAMQIWKKEKRDQLFLRCETVVSMVEDVNDYSKGTAEAGLYTVRDHYLRVMAHNAPTLRALMSGKVGMIWRRMPFKERIRCAARLIVPAALVQKVKGAKG